MRIKTTKELQDTYYPEHMRWIPVQDVKQLLNDDSITCFEDLADIVGSLQMKFEKGMESKSTLTKKKYAEFNLTDEQIKIIKENGDKGYVVSFDMFNVIVGYYYDNTIKLNYFYSFRQYDEVRE